MKYIKYIVIGIISIIIFFGLFFLLMILMFNVSIVWNWAEYPEYPETMPLYISTNETSISLFGDRIPDVQITEKNAEKIVRTYLIEHYVFPDDMIYKGTFKSYISEVKNGREVRKIFNGFDVSYGRVINNLSVYPGDEINIRITEDGFIDLGHMLYRNYTEAGEATLLSPQQAFEKLKNREDVLDESMTPYSYIVKEISLCYWYISDKNMLIPAWHFKGDTCGFTVIGYSSYEYQSDIK